MALREDAGEWRMSTVRYLKTGRCKPQANKQVILPFRRSKIMTGWQMIATFGGSVIIVFDNTAGLDTVGTTQGASNGTIWRF